MTDTGSYRSDWCIAKTTNTFISQKIPVKKEKLLIPCPGSQTKSCPNVEQEWRCKKCGFFLEYGYGEYFFCLCGAALVNTYSFKCSNKCHGNEFLCFDENSLKQQLSTIFGSKIQNNDSK